MHSRRASVPVWAHRRLPATPGLLHNGTPPLGPRWAARAGNQSPTRQGRPPGAGCKEPLAL